MAIETTKAIRNGESIWLHRCGTCWMNMSLIDNGYIPCDTAIVHHETCPLARMFKIPQPKGGEVLVTRAQWNAIKRKFEQDPDGSESLEDFCKRVIAPNGLDDCLMIRWCNMWLGIEQDGYTHS